MPGNPKFDQLHSVTIAPKLEKSTNYDYNLISSEGEQDISACKMSGRSLNAFSKKCLETPNFTHFTEWKLLQKEENQQTIIKI